MNKFFLGFLLLGVIISCSHSKPLAEQSISENNKKVFFPDLKDGDTLTSPFLVKMGVEGMKIEPAGMSRSGFGHHHILVNRKGWLINNIIPMSDSTFHYGKGQTEATLELAPGKYILTLQFGDGVHASLGEELATSINIIVQ
jgi:hypothetical protein